MKYWNLIFIWLISFQLFAAQTREIGTDVILLPDQGTTPSTPAAGKNKLYMKAGIPTYQKSDGFERPLGSSSSSNYISFPDAEFGTTGWATYADAAGTSPVDGTGGSPTSTWTRSTSSPLKGTASFLFTKPASNVQGQGFSYDFTIDPIDQGKVLRIDLDYQISSGTYADDDVQFWIYDTNATLIQPAPFKLKNTTIKDSFAMEFQTSTSSTSFRLIGHVASTSALAYTLKFDNFSIARGAKVYSKGETIYSAQVSSAAAILSQAPSFISSCTSTGAGTGYCNFVSGVFTVAPNCVATINIDDSSTYAGNTISSVTKDYFYFRTQASPSGSVSRPQYVFCHKQGADYTNATSGRLSSSEADTRVIAAKYRLSANTAVTAGNPIPFNSGFFDTHSAFNTSNGRFTSPVQSYYKVSFYAQATTAIGVVFDIFKNGSFENSIGMNNSNGGSGGGGSSIVYLNANEYVDIRPSVSATIQGGSTSGGAFISIEKISGPSQIAASETVSASYWVSANFAASPTTPINFDSKEWDSHGAVTTSSTAWRFTAPLSGIYQIGGQSESATSNYIQLYKNGVAVKTLGWHTSSAHTVLNGFIKLLAGEYIDLRPQASITVLGSTQATTYTTQVVINRVGNY